MLEPQKPLRAAIIGVGKAAQRTWSKGGGHKIAYDHAEFLNQIPAVRVTTAADINAENLAAFATTFDLSQTYADYREMLRLERPDIVGICTYLGLHAQMVIDAARAGVRIIVCEKPLVSSPAELEAIRQVVEKTGVVLGVAHIRRFKPCFIQARDLVKARAIGQPVLMCGGLAGWDLSEYGSHWIDLIRFIHSDTLVKYVMGQVRVRDGAGYGHRMEDHGIAYFEFADGCRGIVDGGRGFAPPEGTDYPSRPGSDIRIVGTEGVITIAEDKTLQVVNAKGRQTIDVSASVPVWRLLYESLIEQANGGPVSPVAFARCVQTAEINLGAYMSSWLRDRVDLPFNETVSAYKEWPLDAIAESQMQLEGDMK